MTEKQYYSLPYKKELDAFVVSCVLSEQGNYEVILDKTIFYPEGGGQPSDRGFLGDCRVLDVQEQGDFVIHFTDGYLAPGEPVHGVLDWNRRYENMQQHSGEHLFSGLIHRHFGYDNVGFHMGKDQVTVDFNGTLTSEQLAHIEREANEKVYENRPIEVLYPSDQELKKLAYRSKKELTGRIRIVRIPQGDTCACCGIHVDRTGEIGMIKAVDMIRYKGGVRISILCGLRALSDYQKKQAIVETLSHSLSASQDKLAQIVEKLKAESNQKEIRIHKLYQTLFQLKQDHYPESDSPLVIFEEGLEANPLRQLCTLLYQSGRGNPVLVCSKKEGGFQYAMGSETCDLKQTAKEMNRLLNGKGGGTAVFVQGTFSVEEEEDIKGVFFDLHKGV